ncbi:hypothetical protein [Luteolibacter sp. Populi]|uniref:hypothetical protein n=1 Tax=Luteolibacter sp. Populi TaxID=3230487 RepID=UPI003465BD25
MARVSSSPPSKKSFSWLRVLLAVAVIWGGLTFFSRPVIPGHRKNPARIEALNNIKMLGLMLFEFDAEYGKFPDATTIAPVVQKTGTKFILGDASSNQLFRQLLVTGQFKSEKPFWAKTAGTSEKPDDDFSTPAKALAPGECGFAYAAGLSSADEPSTPVVFAPMIPGTLRFDPKPFDGKAIVLRLDNSATPMQIRQDNGEVHVNGMNLFDPRQPWWKGKAPDLRYPE